MEKIVIKNRILTYRGEDYTIAEENAVERIGDEFVHLNTAEGQTIALVPGDTTINGEVQKSIAQLERTLLDASKMEK